MRRPIAFVLAGLLFASLPATAEARAGDPAPGTKNWYLRELANIQDTTGRFQDQYVHPGFFVQFQTETAQTHPGVLLSILAHPKRVRLTLGTALPGGATGDPYRSIDDWDGVRGKATAFSFTNRNGARLTGHLWAPLDGRFPKPYPTVVFTTGSIQAPESLYYWVAEGLAEAGYLVLTYDVQGQGQSETFGHHPDGSVWCGAPKPEASPQEEAEAAEETKCPGVPFQQTANFARGTVDALDFLFSTPAKLYAHRIEFWPESHDTDAFNPWWQLVDVNHVGLAGHSLGATAVSLVQQWDTRVKTIVAFDNLSNVGVPRVPALGINAEYFLNPQPFTSPPGYDAKDGAYQHWRSAGVDTMQVGLRGSTHLEFSYIPYLTPWASRLGERVAMYYTLAWFDRYLKGLASGTTRLTATTFDGSADASSIGAGAWKPPLGNRPYMIGGIPVWERLSFYYRSSYWLQGGSLACADMREGCP